MNAFKRIAAVALVLVMLLSLAACGSFETKMAKAAKKMENLKSWRMDMDMDYAMRISAMGESMDMDVSMTGTGDVMQNPMKLKMDMDMEMMGKTLKLQTYMQQEGDSFISYSSADGGATWTKQSLDVSALPAQAMNPNDFSMLLKIASRYEKTGTETVKGAEATVFSGTIEGDDIQEAIEMSGVLEAMGSSMSSLGMDLSAMDFSDTGSIPTTISIDNKSGMIVKYTMDMTELMKSMMPRLMDMIQGSVSGEAPEGLDPSTLGLSIDIDRVFVTQVLYDFDAVSEITIPEAALNAPELEIPDLAA